MNNPIDKSIRCPHCSATSKNIKRCGKDTDGTQLYLCKKCGKKFRLDKDYSEIKPCPYCNEKSPRNIKLIGKTSSGSQRYFCKTCNHRYSTNTKLLKNNIQCPSCEATSVDIVKAGFNKQGIQRYKCKKCNKYFITKTSRIKHKYKYKYNLKRGNESNSNNKKLIKVACPSCGSVGESVKAGTTGQGKQYYRCRKCGYKYIFPEQKFKQLSRCQAAYLKKCALKGVPKAHIAELLGINVRTVFRYTAEIKGKRARKRESLMRDLQIRKNTLYSLEVKYGMTRKSLDMFVRGMYTLNTMDDLTEKKLNAIISFGKALKIPVEHLTKFVPASKEVKQFIINQYRKKLDTVGTSIEAKTITVNK